VSTTEQVIETGRQRRRRHSAMFKAEAVGACQQPGVSVAAVALARGLHANLLRRWLKSAERRNAPIAIRPTIRNVTDDNAESFVPVSVPAANPPESPIRIELRRKGRSVSIEWPATAAHECALLLRELMR
jgi:transposase